jgi:flavin reductase (DIM6/NTAB) family NADH-FMN oxidoreductase RutF
MRRAGAEGAAAHFECRNEYRHYGSDHIIFIGHIERYAYTHKPTLLFCGGKYMRPDTSRTRRPRLDRSSPSHGAAVLFGCRRWLLTV